MSGKRFVKSFSCAAQGLVFLFKTQQSARIELFISGIVIITGVLFKINTAEWINILLCIALVLGLEGINTALEIIADKLHPGIDTNIRNVKDVAAAAVLVAAIISAIVGFIIFAPKFINLL